jgi:glycosyltransferase involved in cell wall biosynthesis
VKVAVAAGVVIEHDAISAAAVEQLNLLPQLPGVSDVVLLTQHIDRAVPCPSHLVSDPWQLLRTAERLQVDRIVLHWGIHYTTFDAVTLLSANGPPAAVHFHNCTPRSLVPEEQRPVIDRSLAQISHAIGTGLPMWTYSRFNELTLAEWGALPSQIRFVPIVIEAPPFTGGATMRQDERIQITVVGRMVAAKGLHVALEAIAHLGMRERAQLRVVFAGSATFSDRAYIERLHEAGAGLGPAEVVFVEGASDHELWDILRRSDVVMSPSFHEGLCVPVIEGFLVGCRALVSDAANLPHLVTDDDQVVPVGDAEALAIAISHEIARGPKHDTSPTGPRADVTARHSRLTTRACLAREL